MGTTETNLQLYLTANQNSRVEQAWIEIRRPDGVLTSGGGTGQVILNLETVFLSLNSATGSWETVWNGFTLPGKYEIFYYTKDNLSGEISPPVSSTVYKNKDGNTQPTAFNLQTPTDNAKERTFLAPRWESSSDPDGLTYTLLVCTDPGCNSLIYKQDEIAETFAIIPNGILKDLTSYYWRVIAIDSYGGQQLANQTRRFTTDNTNGLPGLIKGLVINTLGQPLVGATVSVSNGTTTSSLSNGIYLL